MPRELLNLTRTTVVRQEPGGVATYIIRGHGKSTSALVNPGPTALPKREESRRERNQPAYN